MGVPKSVRLPSRLEHELEREFARRGVKEWSAGVVDLLSEAVRMRRVPGVVFVDSRIGRRPMVAGTGLDVWELVATWLAVGRDEAALREATDWLTEAQRRSALNYYALYPEEIDARLAADDAWTAERVRDELPFTAHAPAATVASPNGGTGHGGPSGDPSRARNGSPPGSSPDAR